jgi:hypothetical protein
VGVLRTAAVQCSSRFGVCRHQRPRRCVDTRAHVRRLRQARSCFDEGATVRQSSRVVCIFQFMSVTATHQVLQAQQRHLAFTCQGLQDALRRFSSAAGRSVVNNFAKRVGRQRQLAQPTYHLQTRVTGTWLHMHMHMERGRCENRSPA